jgi:hypothetical protein
MRVTDSEPRGITNDGVAGARNDDRQVGKRTASPNVGLAHERDGKTAMEMTSLWKPKSGSHRDLEISPRTRDFHIPTADHLVLRKEKTKNEDASERHPINQKTLTISTSESV